MKKMEIKYKIKKFRNGYVFSIDDLKIDASKRKSSSTILAKLAESGKLRRLVKGRYYKPQFGILKELKPGSDEVIKDLLVKDNKPIGYISGYSIFNKLNLTTQVPNTIQIATNKNRKPIKRSFYKISFIKQNNEITKVNTAYLQLLDCVKFVKQIPDNTPDKACWQLIQILKKYDTQTLGYICKLALKYNPATRALAGAMIETITADNIPNSLFKSLNPATRYNIGVTEKTLPNRRKWGIY
jgi:predicted transcriptional regulator of viral defense system